MQGRLQSPMKGGAPIWCTALLVTAKTCPADSPCPRRAASHPLCSSAIRESMAIYSTCLSWWKMTILSGRGGGGGGGGVACTLGSNSWRGERECRVTSPRSHARMAAVLGSAAPAAAAGTLTGLNGALPRVASSAKIKNSAGSSCLSCSVISLRSGERCTSGVDFAVDLQLRGPPAVVADPSSLTFMPSLHLEDECDLLRSLAIY